MDLACRINQAKLVEPAASEPVSVTAQQNHVDYVNATTTGEGMGVMHSTNIDHLFNDNLRTIMKRVVERVQSKVAGLAGVRLNVAVNGVVYTETSVASR